jgi:calcium-binding protein CML
MLMLFRRFDTNKSGDIDFGEFKNLVHELGRSISDVEADTVFQQLDTDHNGVIDFEEFRTWWTAPKV